MFRGVGVSVLHSLGNRARAYIRFYALVIALEALWEWLTEHTEGKVTLTLKL